jgi:hypothetical protein
MIDAIRSSIFLSWALAFTVTQMVEIPIWMRAFRAPLRFVKAFGATAITHPILWFVITPRWRGDYWSMVIFGEAVVVLIEAAYARFLGAKRALLWSLVANGASAGLGIGVYAALGWL